MVVAPLDEMTLGAMSVAWTWFVIYAMSAAFNHDEEQRLEKMTPQERREYEEITDEISRW